MQAVRKDRFIGINIQPEHYVHDQKKQDHKPEGNSECAVKQVEPEACSPVLSPEFHSLRFKKSDSKANRDTGDERS